MALSKQFLKIRSACKVRFTLTPAEYGDAPMVFLAGDFNGWDHEKTPMRRMKNGDVTVALELPLGASYQFRYRTADGHWLNDADADAYEFCEFAQAENCILQL